MAKRLPLPILTCRGWTLCGTNGSSLAHLTQIAACGCESHALTVQKWRPSPECREFRSLPKESHPEDSCSMTCRPKMHPWAAKSNSWDISTGLSESRRGDSARRWRKTTREPPVQRRPRPWLLAQESARTFRCLGHTAQPWPRA